MYTEEELTRLEEEEREFTDEAILLMLLVLADTKSSLEKELRNFYQKYGKDGVVTYAEARKWVSEQDHRRRLNALLMVLSGTFVSTLVDLKTKFEKMLKSVIGKETGFFDVEIDIDFILKHKWGVDDSTWLQRLEDDVDLWRLNIARDWKRAILQGKKLDYVLNQLDKRFESIESVMKKLGISESTAIGSLARQKAFEELGISKYQFFSKPDERRCEVCGALHGKIFPMSAYEVGVTAPNLHPFCRCFTIPILE